MVFEQPAFVSVEDGDGHAIPVTTEEIRVYISGRGWKPISPPMVEFWFHPETRMRAGDAHAGNFIKTEEGVFPIELLVEQLSAANAKIMAERYAIKPTE